MGPVPTVPAFAAGPKTHAQLLRALAGGVAAAILLVASPGALARAEHGGEPTSDMTETERRVAYEIHSHLNAERAENGLPTLAAYYDWTRAARGADAVVDSGSANAVDLSAELAWYGARGMAALDVVNRYSPTQERSGAVVAHLMESDQRDRLLTPRADVLAVGVACRDGKHAVTLHLIASTDEVAGAQAAPAAASQPAVTSPVAGTDCTDEGAHPDPPVGVDPRLVEPQPPVPSDRVAGPTRIDTALAISQRTHPDPAAVDTVIVATANDFPDAVATGPAAARLGSPVLLTWRDSLPEAVAAELERLNASRIAVVGGAAVVGPDVLERLDEIAPVVRWEGGDRTATASAVSEQVWPGGAQTVYLAPADDHAPALSAAVPAGYGGHPLLLTWRDSLADAAAAELVRLAPAEVVLVGGEGWLAQEVADAVAALVPGAQVERLDADDPYALAVAAADRTPAPERPLFLATADSYPDALAAAPAVVAEGGRLLLVPTSGGAPQVILDAAAGLCPTQVVIFGGTAAVDATVVDSVLAAVADAC